VVVSSIQRQNTNAALICLHSSVFKWARDNAAISERLDCERLDDDFVFLDVDGTVIPFSFEAKHLILDPFYGADLARDYAVFPPLMQRVANSLLE